MKLHKKIMTL